MKRNRVQNLSANALQLVLNQLFGLVIFYILSVTLDKNSFGQVNLALAILLAVFNILSMGIDQLVIKKIASGDDISSTLSLYIFHVIITGFTFYGLLLVTKLFWPSAGTAYSLILFIGIGKLMIFLSTPFKQVTNGLERFRLLAYMSIISNLIRCICLLLFASEHQITLTTIVIIFVAGDVFELLCSALIFRFAMKVPLSFTWDKIKYRKLLHEASPQAGVVVITSVLARFDWIFIGLFVSEIKLAEYSFAYKVYEVATLPMLVIAPLLIPIFTKLFKNQSFNVSNLKFLVRIEMAIAAFIILLLNICWSPLIDYLTAGKYGAVNANTIFILSLCMPFLYMNNFLWTMYFAQGRLRMILSTFIITLIANVLSDVILIPIFKNDGAAAGFLIAQIAQTIFFMNKNQLAELKNSWQPLLISPLLAICAILISHLLFQNNWLLLLASILTYFVLLTVTGQVKLTDRKVLIELLTR